MPRPDEVLFQAAIAIDGRPAQFEKLKEELKELLQAVIAFQEDPVKDNAVNIAEEIADVEIMIGQIAFLMPAYMTAWDVRLETFRTFKRNRFKERLQERGAYLPLAFIDESLRPGGEESKGAANENEENHEES